MKRLIFVFLVIGATMIFFGCSENNSTAPELSQSDLVTNTMAKKPAPNLIGEAVIDFTFTPPTFWNGTIDFGTDGKYGMTFISYDPPRDFSQASPYYEDFYIYELGTDFDWENPTNVVMKGWNAGVVTYANKDPEPVKVRANGEIVEAFGSFKMWESRKVHMQGLVYWESVGLPDVAISTVRIN